MELALEHDESDVPDEDPINEWGPPWSTTESLCCA